MLAGSVPGKLHHRGASTAFWAAMPKSSRFRQYLQAALSLEISTGGAADYRRPTVFQSHTAVKGVHSALPRCNYVGWPGAKLKPLPARLLKQNAGPFSYKARTEGI